MHSLHFGLLFSFRSGLKDTMLFELCSRPKENSGVIIPSDDLRMGAWSALRDVQLLVSGVDFHESHDRLVIARILVRMMLHGLLPICSIDGARPNEAASSEVCSKPRSANGLSRFDNAASRFGVEQDGEEAIA